MIVRSANGSVLFKNQLHATYIRGALTPVLCIWDVCRNTNSLLAHSHEHRRNETFLIRLSVNCKLYMFLIHALMDTMAFLCAILW